MVSANSPYGFSSMNGTNLSSNNTLSNITPSAEITQVSEQLIHEAQHISKELEGYQQGHRSLAQLAEVIQNYCVLLKSLDRDLPLLIDKQFKEIFNQEINLTQERLQELNKQKVAFQRETMQKLVKQVGPVNQQLVIHRAQLQKIFEYLETKDTTIRTSFFKITQKKFFAENLVGVLNAQNAEVSALSPAAFEETTLLSNALDLWKQSISLRHRLVEVEKEDPQSIYNKLWGLGGITKDTLNYLNQFIRTWQAAKDLPVEIQKEMIKGFKQVSQVLAWQTPMIKQIVSNLSLAHQALLSASQPYLRYTETNPAELIKLTYKETTQLENPTAAITDDHLLFTVQKGHHLINQSIYQLPHFSNHQLTVFQHQTVSDMYQREKSLPMEEMFDLAFIRLKIIEEDKVDINGHTGRHQLYQAFYQYRADLLAAIGVPVPSLSEMSLTAQWKIDDIAFIESLSKGLVEKEILEQALTEKAEQWAKDIQLFILIEKKFGINLFGFIHPNVTSDLTDVHFKSLFELYSDGHIYIKKDAIPLLPTLIEDNINTRHLKLKETLKKIYPAPFVERIFSFPADNFIALENVQVVKNQALSREILQKVSNCLIQDTSRRELAIVSFLYHFANASLKKVNFNSFDDLIRQIAKPNFAKSPSKKAKNDVQNSEQLHLDHLNRLEKLSESIYTHLFFNYLELESYKPKEKIEKLIDVAERIIVSLSEKLADQDEFKKLQQAQKVKQIHHLVESVIDQTVPSEPELQLIFIQIKEFIEQFPDFSEELNALVISSLSQSTKISALFEIFSELNLEMKAIELKLKQQQEQFWNDFGARFLEKLKQELVTIYEHGSCGRYTQEIAVMIKFAKSFHKNDITSTKKLTQLLCQELHEGAKKNITGREFQKLQKAINEAVSIHFNPAQLPVERLN